MSIIHIAGHLGRDADFRQGATEAQDVLNFSVADNSGEKDRDGNPLPPTWYHCSIWGKRAGALAQYLTKGSAVSVCGKHRPREYTGRDGVTRTSQDVRVLEITLQGSKSLSNQGTGAPPQTQYTAPQPAQAAPQPTPAQQSYAQTAAIWGQPKPLTYADVKGGTPYVPTPAQTAPQAAPAGVFVPQAAPQTAPAPQTEAPAPAGFDNFADDDIPF